MEHSILPADTIRLVDWLLQTTISNQWTVVVEYANERTHRFLTKYAVEVPLPPKARHLHHTGYRLTALTNVFSSEKFAAKLMSHCCVLSIHNQWEMLFLISDNFQEDCFSCKKSFYNRYWEELDKQELIHAY